MGLVGEIHMVAIHAYQLLVALFEELGRNLREHGVGQDKEMLLFLLMVDFLKTEKFMYLVNMERLIKLLKVGQISTL